MRVLESWQDIDGQVYAIVRRSQDEQASPGHKPFGVMYLTSVVGETETVLSYFFGPLQMGVSQFDTVAEARCYLHNGLAQQEENPDIWEALLDTHAV